MPPFSRSLDEEGACIKSFKLVKNGIFQEKELTHILLNPGKQHFFIYPLHSLTQFCSVCFDDGKRFVFMIFQYSYLYCYFIRILSILLITVIIITIVVEVNGQRLPGQLPISGTRNLKDNISDLKAQVLFNE